MSKLGDTRFALVSWAKVHGHNLEECISLVDAVENLYEAIVYANSEAEESAAIEDYRYLVGEVTAIYDGIIDSKNADYTKLPLNPSGENND